MSAPPKQGRPGSLPSWVLILSLGVMVFAGLLAMAKTMERPKDPKDLSVMERMRMEEAQAAGKEYQPESDAVAEALKGMVMLALGAGGLALYLLPLLIASRKGHPYTTAITLINLVLGWTFLGWLGALIWAVSPPGGDRYRPPVPPASTPS